MLTREIKFNSTRKFGVELEFNSPRQATLKRLVERIDGEGCVVSRYTHNHNNREWYAKTDSSCGYELASRVMSGWRDVLKLGMVVEQLNNYRGVDCSRGCGMHIHVNVSDFSIDQIGVLLSYWIKCEHIFFSMLPIHRRNNSYCRMQNMVSVQDHFSPNMSGHELMRNWTHRGALNTSHYAGNESASRVEFRLGHMSTDPDHVKNWSKLLVWFVDHVKLLPRPSNFNWLDLKHFMRLMDLMNDNKDVVDKHYSSAVQGIRLLIVNSLAEFQSLNIEKTNLASQELIRHVVEDNERTIEEA